MDEIVRKSMLYNVRFDIFIGVLFIFVLLVCCCYLFLIRVYRY